MMSGVLFKIIVPKLSAGSFILKLAICSKFIRREQKESFILGKGFKLHIHITFAPVR